MPNPDERPRLFDLMHPGESVTHAQVKRKPSGCWAEIALAVLVAILVGSAALGVFLGGCDDRIGQERAVMGVEGKR